MSDPKNADSVMKNAIGSYIVMEVLSADDLGEVNNG